LYQKLALTSKAKIYGKQLMTFVQMVFFYLILFLDWNKLLLFQENKTKINTFIQRQRKRKKHNKEKKKSLKTKRHPLKKRAQR
jgi:hypothetical protein